MADPDLGRELDVGPEAVDYPGARGPDRRRTVDSHGVRLAVYEWGDPDAPPLALAHGGFDFARTYDVFAPLLADAGWRVVAWDQRGHGASEHTALYSFDADIRDMAAVIDSIGPAPLPAIGHSKGGSLLVQLTAVLPHRISRLVNLDGLPSRRNWPDVPDHLRTKLRAGELGGWLDSRRSAGSNRRKPGTIDELATRRGRMNPRLSHEWLRYLASVGARHDADGWRWSIDPSLRLGGFGPWRPEWALRRLAAVGVPFLAVLATEPELMGWGTRPEDLEPYIPPTGRLVPLEGVGHFVHIEQTERVAELVLDFLGPPTWPDGGGVAAGASGASVPSGAVDVSGAADAGSGRPLRSVGPGGSLGPVSSVPSRSRRVGPEDALSPTSSVPPSPVGDRREPTVTLRHNKIDLALHRLREGDGRPLLLLHGLAERSPDEVPAHLAPWPGPVWALDFTGHGSSTVPAGGGYFAEVLMGDVDIALSHLGPATLYGRGLGAYVALLAAGSRPELVRGAILDDGPGLDGGGPEPGSGYVQTEPLRTPGPPDPYALLELSRDIRPPDYAATFAHQAATLSGLDTALAVTTAVRPPWLTAVAQQPGVHLTTRQEALTLFAPTP